MIEDLTADCDGCERNGVDADAITVIKAPGAWELPLLCQKVAEGGAYDAIVA